MRTTMAVLTLTFFVGCGGMEEDLDELAQAGMYDLAEEEIRLQFSGHRPVPGLPGELRTEAPKLAPHTPQATACPVSPPADGDVCNAVPTLSCVGSGYVDKRWGALAPT